MNLTTQKSPHVMKHATLMQHIDARALSRLSHTPDSDAQVRAREIFGHVLQQLISSVSSEYQYVSLDVQTELQRLTNGDQMLYEDVTLPVDILCTIIADYAFQLGYIASKKEDAAVTRQRRQSLIPVSHHYAWTRNLTQMLSHDAPFNAYLVSHNETIHTAIETLRTGATLADAAKRSNVSSPSKLRRMIRREFDTYLEKIV